MDIIKEFESSRGPKKAYIVRSSLGPRVAVDAGREGEITDWPTREEDGTLTFNYPDQVPKYVQKLAEKAFAELDDLRDERHEEMGFTEWLLQQAKRKDPVGALARDAKNDPEWPSSATSHAELADYLNVSPMRRNVAVSLAQAWSEYIREQRIEEIET